MKTGMIRAVVVAFALAAFGFLAISPSRAQSSTSNSGASPAGGCCGSTSTSNTSSSH